MRLLIVEDDKKLAGYLTKGLTEENYTVDVCYDGAEGLEWAILYDYDLIILDIMLPGKNGMEVCQAIRARRIFTPILLLTAKDSVECRVEGLDCGADDFLAKPFSYDELLARIRAALRRTQTYQTPVLKIADLVLDPGSHQVTRRDTEIQLTAKEYALLEYLMRNRDRVVTETNIIDHVWGTQQESFTNVVSVYIHYLRNKVDKGFDQKLIHTVRGLGYVMRDPADG